VDNKADLLRRESDNLQFSCTTEEGKETIMEWLTDLAVVEIEEIPLEEDMLPEEVVLDFNFDDDY